MLKKDYFNRINAMILFFLLLFLYGCSGTSKNADTVTTDNNESSKKITSMEIKDEDDFFINTELASWTDTGDIHDITLSDSGSVVDTEYMTVEGSAITIHRGGKYRITGSLSNGSICINCGKTEQVSLLLDEVYLASQDGNAISIVQCGELWIYTAADTNNTIISTYDAREEDSTANAAAIFSKEDLVLMGEGSLEVVSAYGNGIVSKDNLKIVSGTYTVTADGHGICGKDSVCIKDGTFTITSGKDGIHAENNDIATYGSVYLFGGVYTINASGDGISASHTLQINNGSYHITSGGGSENGAAHMESEKGKMFDRGDFGNRFKGIPMENSSTDGDAANTEIADSDSVSCKGIKAELALEISGGSFDLNTADDALHVNGSMSILGGVFHIRTGDDGIHADDRIIITDGEINIMESYEGIEAFEIIICGGKITVTSDDDGLNASDERAEPYENRDMQTLSSEKACIQISGGDIYVDAGGDGIDSNGDIQISGGNCIVEADAASANGALDYDGEGSITGGTFLALGGSSMAMNFDNYSTQGCALINLGQQINPSSVILYDADGAVLFTYDAKKTYNSILISLPDMQVSMTYTLVTGDVTTEICMSELVYGNGYGMGMNGGVSRHDDRQFDFPPSGEVPQDHAERESKGNLPFGISDGDIGDQAPFDRVPEGAPQGNRIPAENTP